MSASTVPKGRRMAAAAAACVTAVAREGGTVAARYRTRAVEFPALLMGSGLCQALAFVAARSGRDQGNKKDELAAAYRRYRDDLAHVLEQDWEGLSRSARDLPLRSYLALEAHALNAALWLKRYAEAYIDPSGSRGGEPDGRR